MADCRLHLEWLSLWPANGRPAIRSAPAPCISAAASTAFTRSSRCSPGLNAPAPRLTRQHATFNPRPNLSQFHLQYWYGGAQHRMAQSPPRTEHEIGFVWHERGETAVAIESQFPYPNSASRVI